MATNLPINTLLHGDCAEVLSRLPKNSVDVPVFQLYGLTDKEIQIVAGKA